MDIHMAKLLALLPSLLLSVLVSMAERLFTAQFIETALIKAGNWVVSKAVESNKTKWAVAEDFWTDVKIQLGHRK